MEYNGVIISGYPLCGKSTLARELGKTLNWRVHSVGDIFKNEWKRFHQKNNISFEDYWKSVSIEDNRKVDKETRKKFEEKNLVGDFRYAVSCKGLNIFTVFVTANSDVQIERAIKSGRYDGKSIDEIKKILNERIEYETQVGKQLYGKDYDFKDPKNYNLIINLGELNNEKAVNLIKTSMANGKLSKIYFACSIAGGRDFEHLYPEIINHLKKHGEVLTEIFSHKKILEMDSQISDVEIFDRDIEWINESQLIAAEVSQPSLGVGFEIGTALSKGKKVLCLYKNQQNRNLSAMISGNKNIYIIRYDDLEEAKQKIDKFFNNPKTNSS